MTQDIKKEFMYGLRSSRFLIIAATFMFLGLLTPIMTKVILPAIFKSQFPGMDDSLIAEMINMSQHGSLQGFFNDLFEMGTLVVAFTLCGLLAQELHENTLIIPLCSGKRFSRIVSAKLLVFSLALTVSVIMAGSASYLYSGLLFSFDINYLTVLQAGLLQSLYLIFILAALLFWGTITSKPIATGILTLFMAYAIQGVGGLFDIHKWLPSGLITQVQALKTDLDSSLGLTVAITTLLIVLLSALSLARLRTLELNHR